MTLVVACLECSYGALQQNQDTKGIELGMLKDIHEMTFKHNVVIRDASIEDVLKYDKKNKK